MQGEEASERVFIPSRRERVPEPAPARRAGLPKTSTDQSSGRKSQAVFVLGAGMPGVSGDENMSGPPTSCLLAKEPGVVTFGVAAGLRAPRWGRGKRESVVM
jgi:hypothetical protein